MSRVLAILAAVATIALAACGDDDDDPGTTSTPVAGGPCSPIEEVEIGAFEHVPDELTADDYATNPPTWGDHNDPAITAGRFYEKGAPLGEAVHFLEHGAVIGWTNGLTPEDLKAVQDAFNEVYREGYYQVAVVENAELEVPFALSAWGAMQTCEEVDAAVVRPFVEEWYASPKSPESVLACQAEARRLPPC